MARPCVRFTVFGCEPVTLDRDDWAPVHRNGEKVCDVYRAGNECGVAYGDVDHPVTQKHEGAVLVELVDGDLSHTVADETDVVLEYGTMRPYWITQPELVIDERDQPFIDYTLGGGPDPASIDWDSLSAKARKWGPDPDPEDADETGSGRVFSQRCPVALRMLATGEATPAVIEDAMRWVRSQATRGMCFYRSSRSYAPWDAWDEPELLVGQGYRAKGGGFSTHYGRKRPPGVTWDLSGRATGAAAHLTIESLVYIAVFLRSYTAGRLALHNFQAVASYLRANESWSARSFGWFLRSAGHLAPLMQYVNVGGSVTAGCHALELLLIQSGRGCPVPDNGRTAEGGHLSFDTVRELAPPFIPDAEVHRMARSGCSWQVGILVSGLDTLVDLWDRYSVWEHAGHRRVAIDALKVCAAWLHSTAGGEMLNVAGDLKTPSRPASGVWENVSETVLLAEGGWEPQTMKGVYIRFLVPALYAAAERLGRPELLDLAQPTLNHCDEARFWNTSNVVDWTADAGWPVAAVRGLEWQT